jgi:hypothetical protein
MLLTIFAPGVQSEPQDAIYLLRRPAQLFGLNTGRPSIRRATPLFSDAIEYLLRVSPTGKPEGLTALVRFGYLSQGGPGAPHAEQLRLIITRYLAAAAGVLRAQLRSPWQGIFAGDARFSDG